MYETQGHIDLRNSDYLTWFRFLSSTEKWGKQEIDDYQLAQLKRVVTYAYQSVAGYRALYERAGVHPQNIRTLEDIREFPYVEKELIRDDVEKFSVSMPGRTYTTTGGSTGIPFGFYRDAQSFSKELASKAYQYYRIGWKEGDRQLVFRGLPIDTPDHTVFASEFNELRCSSYHLMPEQMEVYRQHALEYRPDWIRCYPSSGYIFAQWLLETGRFFPPIKGILCASENLYDFQKEVLRRAFPNARVFSHYGHYELAVLAGFCEFTDDYHVLPQYGYAELVDIQGQPVTKPGQIGEIVGTSFIMHATPFIRYRTHDFAVFKNWGCPACGRPYQIWERIEGRLQEFIITGSGRLISMTAINFHDDIFDHIKQFQFHQREQGQVTFRYVPKNTCNEVILQTIHQRLLSKLGADVVLALEKVDDIPLTNRGKHRFLIQELSLKSHDEGISVWALGEQRRKEVENE
ncbi:MAG: phenylacetate--CoA ligase family protein [Caldilineaceae bacterium]|nr:phenylacetate--CoA ligase family protein [Caldilineaceae bacterium]